MQAAADLTPSGMVSVLGLERSQVAELCDQVRQPGEILQIANVSVPRQYCRVGARPGL